MSKLKITGIVTLAIFLVFSIGCISWYSYIKMFGEEKVVSTTFEIGLQTTVDGDTKYFMEVNSFDNCFEVKFNYMLDENREHFYSQGLQYYKESGNISLFNTSAYSVTKSETNIWGWETTHYSVKDIYTSNSTRRNYMSSNDYDDCLISTNPIGYDTRFKITLDRDGKDVIYLMGFKGSIPGDQDVKVKGNWYTDYYDYYTIYDVDRLAGLVYKGIQSLSYGTSHACVFEFGDLFDYYEPDASREGVYKLIEPNSDETGKIIEDIKSYYSIKVTKHEGNIQKASDSLFKCVNGNPNFNLVGFDSQDYFYGRTIINVDNEEGASEFSYVKLSETQIAFKLNDKFNSAYLEYSDKIELDILVNIDLIKSEGLEFVGFTYDSGLDNYHIKSCRTMETIDGELVYSEVEYV